jgi:hypothetical protein
MSRSAGTQLAAKLGIHPGLRVLLLNVPTVVRQNLRSALTECFLVRPGQGAHDFALVFGATRSTLFREFTSAVRDTTPSGAIWACWPKKSSGVVTDLDDNGVRQLGLRAGLVDVKVVSVTETWSGLKFVRRLQDRER